MKIKYSKYNGVSWSNRRKPWRAKIIIGGVIMYLGSFLYEEDAARAVDAVVRANKDKLHGKKYILNFPLDSDFIRSEIKLSGGEVTSIDEEDFDRINVYTWNVDKRKNKKYARARIKIGGKYKNIYLHRFIMGDIPKGMTVDHINGNSLDNRKVNLRICSIFQNHQNMVNCKQRVLPRGVYTLSNSNKYEASISINGKHKYLGLFETIKEASDVYINASIKHRGEFSSVKNIQNGKII